MSLGSIFIYGFALSVVIIIVMFIIAVQSRPIRHGKVKATRKNSKAVIVFETKKGLKKVTSNDLTHLLFPYRDNIKRWRIEIKTARKAASRANDIGSFDATALTAAKKTFSEMERAVTNLDKLIAGTNRASHYTDGALNRIKKLEERISDLWLNGYLQSAIEQMEYVRDNPEEFFS